MLGQWNKRKALGVSRNTPGEPSKPRAACRNRRPCSTRRRSSKPPGLPGKSWSMGAEKLPRSAAAERKAGRDEEQSAQVPWRRNHSPQRKNEMQPDFEQQRDQEDDWRDRSSGDRRRGEGFRQRAFPRRCPVRRAPAPNRRRIRRTPDPPCTSPCRRRPDRARSPMPSAARE